MLKKNIINVYSCKKKMFSVYASGYGASGRLGIGVVESKCVPTLVDGLQNVFVTKVVI